MAVCFLWHFPYPGRSPSGGRYPPPRPVESGLSSAACPRKSNRRIDRLPDATAIITPPRPSIPIIQFAEAREQPDGCGAAAAAQTDSGGRSWRPGRVPGEPRSPFFGIDTRSSTDFLNTPNYLFNPVGICHIKGGDNPSLSQPLWEHPSWPPSSSREANRRNAQLSSGPKSQEGKEKVRLNAVKHGLRAEIIEVLPHEDRVEFARRLDAWFEEYDPRSEIEIHRVRRAAVLTWKIERADRHEIAQLSQSVVAAVKPCLSDLNAPPDMMNEVFVSAADLASFDSSNAGERLRRYQFALERLGPDDGPAWRASLGAGLRPRRNRRSQVFGSRLVNRSRFGIADCGRGGRGRRPGPAGAAPRPTRVSDPTCTEPSQSARGPTRVSDPQCAEQSQFVDWRRETVVGDESEKSDSSDCAGAKSPTGRFRSFGLARYFDREALTGSSQPAPRL